MTVSDDEFNGLVEALGEHGLIIPAEVQDVFGLIIAVKANPVRGRPRAVIPLRPKLVEADANDATPGADEPAEVAGA